MTCPVGYSTSTWRAPSTDDVYAAMDWLAARRRPSNRSWPADTSPQNGIRVGIALVRPVQSSWLDRPRCPLAARGYSRDGKKGKPQIEYGLLTDPKGRRVAVRVLPGNTGDPAAFTEIVDVVRDKFGWPDGHGRGPRHDHPRPDRAP